MSWRSWVIAVLILCAILLGTFELFALLSKTKGDTISEVMRDMAGKLGKLWMILPITVAFVIGLLTGHFRWLLSPAVSDDK
jgi:hypothetical protein